jgi:hypothetical protein
VKKFLFLEPAQEAVQTDQGILMVDSSLAGQVFVKGIWVSDMREDGLKAGVDFYRMRLDRDRQAVVHKSDIDHQVLDVCVCVCACVHVFILHICLILGQLNMVKST